MTPLKQVKDSKFGDFYKCHKFFKKLAWFGGHSDGYFTNTGGVDFDHF